MRQSWVLYRAYLNRSDDERDLDRSAGKSDLDRSRARAKRGSKEPVRR
ncbi:MAG TPA: hypothetical protein VF984_11710 [Actinomycetota bacterium]